MRTLSNRTWAAAACIALLAVAGCTAIHVEALPSSILDSGHVCIERNPAVVISDFLDVVRDGFDRHGISSEIYDRRPAEGCNVTVTYTARQSWDLVTFLSRAEIRVWRDGRRIAYAEHHLRGKGGYALTKYQRTATKMKPVMDQLLKEYQRSQIGTSSGPA